MTNSELEAAIAAAFNMVKYSVSAERAAMNAHFLAMLEIQRKRAAEPEFKGFE